MRIIRIITLAAIAAILTALPSSVRADKPLRSGTITGWGYTWPAMFSGEARNCQWDEWTFEFGLRGANPECRVWLDSGCDPDLAGREPAITASIKDVSELADGTTSRLFEWDAAPGSQLDNGGGVVQLWSSDCTEILGSEWRSVNRQGSCCSWINEKSHTFVMSRTATWMTVTTNDTVGINWTLT